MPLWLSARQRQRRQDRQDCCGSMMTIMSSTNSSNDNNNTQATPSASSVVAKRRIRRTSTKMPAFLLLLLLLLLLILLLSTATTAEAFLAVAPASKTAIHSSRSTGGARESSWIQKEKFPRAVPSPLSSHRRRPAGSLCFSPAPHHHHHSARTTTGSSSTTSLLRSLSRLLEQVEQSVVANNNSNNSNNKPQQPTTVFVGGKGGVGKTTVGAALAVQLAASQNSNSDIQNVLVVSTDPAHSLGDALDENLRVSGSAGKAAVPLTDPLTHGRLWAQEVDAVAALEEFRTTLQAFDVDRLAAALQVPPEILKDLGLQEFSSLLHNPPPGLDELVALSRVLEPNKKNDKSGVDFDVVVVDTAPTGHTLRLLQLPQFLDGLLGKLIQLRVKLAGLASTLQSFLGSASEQAAQRQRTLDDALERLETFKAQMQRLRATLQDADQCRFVVVTVPTVLGVAETKRLITELTRQNVAVTDLVVNQCVGVATTETENASGDGGAPSSTDEALHRYYERRCAGQQKWIAKLQETVDKVSNSKEYKENGSHSGPIAVTTVPFFDVELVGVPALGYVGSQIFPDQESFRHLLSTADRVSNQDAPPKVVICGGKGGVGKTTASSSLAVTMAAAGHRVALISTDPAHSLGDAVDMNLQGGKLQECSLVGVPNNAGEGSLSVLEIDPSESLQQFKGVVDQLMGNAGGETDENSGLRNTLKDLQEVFDTLPAGTDEVVALARIVNLVKKGGFDRIVLDTAPTGHTLRMLSTPGFLAELIDRLLSISDKINSNAAVKMFINASSRRDDIKAAVESAKSTLYKFQFQMYDLEDLFADAEQTEFLIVTVATELAVRESARLLNDLTFEAPDMPIKVRNVIVNQVLNAGGDDDDARVFLSHLENSQKLAIADLQRYADATSTGGSGSGSSSPSLVITKVPYLDTEPRGVFGLKVLADELLKEEAGAPIEAS